MGWFDEQIKLRMQNDDDNFDKAFVDLSSVVMGKSALAAAMNSDYKKTKDAIGDILKYYYVKPVEVPNKIKEMSEVLEYLLRPSGIMRRVVHLSGNWYKDSVGPLLAQKSNGDTVALIPNQFNGYSYFDYETGKSVKITKKNKDEILPEVLCFYKPLPMRSLTIKDFIQYIASCISKSDLVGIFLITLVVTVLGLIVTTVNKIIFAQIIPKGEGDLLITVTAILSGVTVSSALFGVVKTMLVTKIQTKLDVPVAAASFGRILSLPASFFKQYSSGDLADRINQMKNICSMLVKVILTTGLSVIFSIIYLLQVGYYAPGLVLPTVVILLLILGYSTLYLFVKLRLNQKIKKKSSKLEGLVFSLFSGVQKIKLSGSERRVFAKWAQAYKEKAELSFHPSMVIKMQPAIMLAITMGGSISLYYFAAKANLNISNYMAFTVAFGMLQGSFLSLSSVVMALSEIIPVIKLIEPILKEAPEISLEKKMVTRISGGIELNNVSFRYGKDQPNIIENLTLKIRPKEYVAIVGSTGCGKSTLMRLILGFETPDKGAVYYDGKDLQSLDLKSLRQKIGVVMQNSKLFSGDIYSNIVITSPWLTIENAWKAAEMAGVADSIRDMPMGMNTIISEGGGGISGGQRQRLLIARAIVANPKVIMFDEATSALDNITQRIVSESLDAFKSTRIVIAHRLSTIKNCDRIIVLDKGKIVEDGKYEELIQNGGFFAELVERQQVK